MDHAALLSNLSPALLTELFKAISGTVAPAPSTAPATTVPDTVSPTAETETANAAPLTEPADAVPAPIETETANAASVTDNADNSTPPSVTEEPTPPSVVDNSTPAATATETATPIDTTASKDNSGASTATEATKDIKETKSDASSGESDDEDLNARLREAKRRKVTHVKDNKGKAPAHKDDKGKAPAHTVISLSNSSAEIGEDPDDTAATAATPTAPSTPSTEILFTSTPNRVSNETLQDHLLQGTPPGGGLSEVVHGVARVSGGLRLAKPHDHRIEVLPSSQTVVPTKVTPSSESVSSMTRKRTPAEFETLEKAREYKEQYKAWKFHLGKHGASAAMFAIERITHACTADMSRKSEHDRAVQRDLQTVYDMRKMPGLPSLSSFDGPLASHTRPWTSSWGLSYLRSRSYMRQAS